jgi:intraflagellar transport protein 74
MEGGVQKAPTGLAVDRPERPSGAASRQQQPVRLGTSSRGGGAGAAGGLLGPPPSTAFRRVLPGSGNQQAQAAAAQAQARPLTQQGIGLEPATAGDSSGRQVLDRTYFINELCQKWQQVFNITGQMRVGADGGWQRAAPAW